MQPTNSVLSPGMEDWWEMRAAGMASYLKSCFLCACSPNFPFTQNTLSKWLGAAHVVKLCSRLLGEDTVEEMHVD